MTSSVAIFIYHRIPTARLATVVYGFRRNTGYRYPARMQRIPTSGTVLNAVFVAVLSTAWLLYNVPS